MAELSRFEQSYFVETRREIDNEKRERDHLLRFAIIVIGAIAFAVFQIESAQDLVQRPEVFALAAPALAIISALFWVRQRKLQQIADRWYVLHRLAVRHFGPYGVPETLEDVVVKGLPAWRYTCVDFALNIAFSLPVYGLLILQGVRGWTRGQPWWAFASFMVIVVHALVSCSILGCSLRNPLPPSAPEADPGKEV